VGSRWRAQIRHSSFFFNLGESVGVKVSYKRTESQSVAPAKLFSTLYLASLARCRYEEKR
jgi:hypothetical protein